MIATIIKTILIQFVVHQTSLFGLVPVHPPAGSFLPLNITPLTSHYFTTCYIYSKTKDLSWLHYNQLQTNWFNTLYVSHTGFRSG